MTVCDLENDSQGEVSAAAAAAVVLKGDTVLRSRNLASKVVKGRAMTPRTAFNIAWSVLGHLQVDDVRAHYRDALPSSSLGPFLRAR